MAEVIATPFRAVVGNAQDHQQRTQVGVAEAQRPVIVAVTRDPVGRVAGEVDQDILGQDEQADGVTEALDIKIAFLVKELEQVDRGPGYRPSRPGTCIPNKGCWPGSCRCWGRCASR